MASEKITKFVEDIKTLTVLELSELVDAIQEEFGVTAAIAAAPAAGAGAAAAAEKTEFDVVLVSFGDAKMGVIKVAKDALGLGLKEAKEVVESAPKTIKEGVSQAEADDLKAKFEAAGATIEIK
ncbi:MAG: 50S ribosomal protein L7/L12 [Ruminococcus sp.]|nr:50S ribosomal protein L7/L12 [Ruminococcus sp.]